MPVTSVLGWDQARRDPLPAVIRVEERLGVEGARGGTASRRTAWCWRVLGKDHQVRIQSELPGRRRPARLHRTDYGNHQRVSVVNERSGKR